MFKRQKIHIVKLIRNGAVQDGVVLDRAVPWLEANKAVGLNFEELVRPQTFKSHFPCDLLPCGPPHATPCKYIYVTRNPKDVAVSFYFHSKHWHPFLKDVDWNSFFRGYIDGEVWYGNFFDHVVSWWPHRNDSNVLFLKYEDMKKNLPQAVSQIASFIGIDLSDDVVSKIAEMTTFDNMKKDDTANRSWMKEHHEEFASNFMRKGVVGDWKNFLTPKQSAEIDSLCAQRLKDIGLEFDYE